MHGQTSEKQTSENVGYELIKTVGVDALFSGHQHRSIAKLVKAKPTLQCAAYAQEFMFLELETMKPGLYPLRGVAIDLGIEAVIKPYAKETQKWMDQRLGRIKGHDFKIINAFQARLHKHPFVSFINQVQKTCTQADISSTALFNEVIGLDEVIHYRDLILNFVYPNSLVVKQMSGKKLRAYIEQCAEYFIVKDGRIVVNPLFDEPHPRHFKYDMMDGIDYTLKISNPVGQRVVELRFNGSDVQDGNLYTVCMNNHRAAGGGNFDMIADCPTVMEMQSDLTEIIAEYIQANKIVTVDHQDNIRILI